MTTLEAGRQVDALVAEKVMGYAWSRSDAPPAGYMGPSGTLLAPWRWLRDPAGRGFVAADGTETPFTENVPRFSTDIAAAFDVLEQLGGIVEITHVTRMAPDDWRVEIGGRLCWAETLPLAICRCALAVAEVLA